MSGEGAREVLTAKENVYGAGQWTEFFRESKHHPRALQLLQVACLLCRSQEEPVVSLRLPPLICPQ